SSAHRPYIYFSFRAERIVKRSAKVEKPALYLSSPDFSSKTRRSAPGNRIPIETKSGRARVPLVPIKHCSWNEALAAEVTVPKQVGPKQRSPSGWKPLTSHTPIGTSGTRALPGPSFRELAPPVELNITMVSRHTNLRTYSHCPPT